MLSFYLTMINSEGDKRKFEQLYLLYHGHMLRTAQKILRDESLAEDAVHQAFLRVMNDMTKIGDVSSHQSRSYLVIIVRGLALNMLRSQRKSVEMPFAELLESAEAEGSIDEMVADAIDSETLRAALAQLPSIHRDVLYLMYYEDRNVRDIAKQLDLSESAVKKRLERARQALRLQVLKKGVSTE